MRRTYCADPDQLEFLNNAKTVLSTIHFIPKNCKSLNDVSP